jgi:Mg2+/Co2+ transporter CorC
LGRVPQPQETITHAPLEMTIESADARKIRKVRVRMQKEETKPDSTPADIQPL